MMLQFGDSQILPDEKIKPETITQIKQEYQKIQFFYPLT